MIRWILTLMLLLFAVTAHPASKYTHIKTAALTFSGTTQVGAGFVSRHYDLAINGLNHSGGANVYDSMKIQDSSSLCIAYVATTSYFAGLDYLYLDTFITETGYDLDLMFLWVDTDTPGDSIGMYSITPAGGACGSSIGGGATDSTVYSLDGDKLLWCGWNQLRTTPDFTYEGAREFVWWRYLRMINNTSASGTPTIFDGAMEDEVAQYHHPLWGIPTASGVFPWQAIKIFYGNPDETSPWGSISHENIIDSLIILKQTGWLSDLMDTLTDNGWQRWANTTNYGVVGSDVVDDQLLIGMNAVFFENALTPITGSAWNGPAWDVFDTLIATSGAGRGAVWEIITIADSLALGSWARGQMERLVYYYMKCDTSFYFLFTANLVGTTANNYDDNDSALKWFDAIAYDIGQPDGLMYTEASGTDGASQSYTIYRRDYTRDDGREVIMLYRKKSGTNYSSASDITVSLGADYQIINVDSTLGSIITSVDIANVEGIMLIEAFDVSNTYKGLTSGGVTLE